MLTIAIDPGTTKSAYSLLDPVSLTLHQFGKVPNEDLLGLIRDNAFGEAHLVIEMIKSYGMAFGDSTIETCVYIGRLIEAHRRPYSLIPRKTIVSELCGKATAKDSNVRRALIDMYSARFPSKLGGGKVPAIGTKSSPGPLYGVSNDVWSAIAIGIAWYNKTSRGLI